jgi:hypothetical protein
MRHSQRIPNFSSKFCPICSCISLIVVVGIFDEDFSIHIATLCCCGFVDDLNYASLVMLFHEVVLKELDASYVHFQQDTCQMYRY